MKRKGGGRSILALQDARSFALVGGVGLVLLVSAAVPLGKARRARPDPTTKATRAYETLQERIGASGAPLEPASSDSTMGTAGTARVPLQRNLFAPVYRAPSPAPPGAAPQAPAGRPALTGIFIDGGVRQAILGGRRVREGDRVEGYRVVEITSVGVVLSKGKTTVRLRWGEVR